MKAVAVPGAGVGEPISHLQCQQLENPWVQQLTGQLQQSGKRRSTSIVIQKMKDADPPQLLPHHIRARDAIVVPVRIWEAIGEAVASSIGTQVATDFGLHSAAELGAIHH